MKSHTTATNDGPLRVVLVLAVHPDDREMERDREAEMRALLETAGCEVVGFAMQHLPKPVGGTYIGSGKIAEIKEIAANAEAEEVVFDVQLTPSQERNLERDIGVRVIDYTALILHIFASNAQTRQAQLAVELAQLEYHRSRLRRLWTHLDRMKAGMNMRGPGEKQLEVDRRLIKDRILDLKAKLQEIEDRKERTIAGRDSCFKVCIVGYTNAGKSTLMNALTGAGVLAQDRLFATLDTRTSRLHLDSHRPVVISDTVGFIRRLPHQLVASFHATLAEAIEADLLLHVVDASQPAMEEQIAAVDEVLNRIGAETVPVLMAFNKIDLAHSPTILLAFKKRYPGSVTLSAANGDGIDRLKAALAQAADRGSQRVEVRVPIADGAAIAFLRRIAGDEAARYDEDAAIFTITADAQLLGELQQNDHVQVTAL